MGFQKRAFLQLWALVDKKTDVYVGATTKQLDEFVDYINSKELVNVATGNRVPAIKVFSTCSYEEVSDAHDSESALLMALGDGAAWNSQRQSNVDEVPGIVYVLHNG